MPTDSAERDTSQQSTEDSPGSEAYEALQSALDDMFYEPVENRIERVRKQIESTLNGHENSMGSGLTLLQEEVNGLRDDIGEFLSAVQHSHETINQQIDAVKGSANQVYSLLTDEQENSRLEQIEEALGSQSEQLQQHSQQLENLDEWQKTHSIAFEELCQDLEEHSSHVQDLDRRTDELISTAERTQTQSEERAQEIKDKVGEIASRQQKILVGLSVWMGVITVALAVVIYLVG